MSENVEELHYLALKINDAERIMCEALAAHLGPRELVGRVILFSGGNDSTTLAHRSSCDARFDRPLVERLPDDPRLDAVLARAMARRAARTADEEPVA